MISITTNKYLSTVLKPLIVFCKFIGRRYPEQFVKIRYYVRFHKKLNIETPRTLNEKILYLLLRTDTTQWTDLADKYEVRKYIIQCGLGDILVNLYGAWDNAINIDFTKLPKKFVLKCNHGSGDVYIIQDKDKLDKDKMVKVINKALITKFGELEGGSHYFIIKPKVIAEEFMENDEMSEKLSSTIIDYKIWCFNGKAKFVWTCFNRDTYGADVMTYDLQWNAHPEYSIFNSHYRYGKVMPKPNNLDELISIAEKLAKPFICVRVDLYNIGEKVYFGEMTFTSLGGMMNFYTDEFQQLAGDMIDLSNVKVLC